MKRERRENVLVVSKLATKRGKDAKTCLSLRQLHRLSQRSEHAEQTDMTRQITDVGQIYAFYSYELQQSYKNRSKITWKNFSELSKQNKTARPHLKSDDEEYSFNILASL